MADEGVVPDENYWNTMAQREGPGYAASMRQAFEARQPAGPIDAPGETAPPVTSVVPPPAPPAALLPPPAGQEAPKADPIVPQATPQNEQPFTPPGPQTVSTTDSHTQIQMGQKLDPFLQAQTHAAQLAEAGAREKVTEIQADTDRKMAAVEEKRAAEEAAEREKNRIAAAERKRIADEHAQKVADAQKEADAVKEPPEESLGQRFSQALALGLGAFGAGLTGGPNQAAQVIAADREQKMQTWKAQYARAKGKVDNANNLYAMFRNKGLDEESSEALAIKNLNDGYATVLRGYLAGSKAPITIANGEAEQERIRQSNLAQDQRLQQAAQNQVTRVIDDKSVTKTGGDSKEQADLIDRVDKDKLVQAHVAASGFLSKYQNLVKNGADATAIGLYIAGKEGLGQGSYGPSMEAMLKKYSWLEGGVEKVRSALQGGANPQFVKEISNALAADAYRAKEKAAGRIGMYEREAKRVGVPRSALLGNDTPTEAAAAAGAVPSAYQGKQ